MVYIVDNILNYTIYLFISHFGFRLSPRKNVDEHHNLDIICNARIDTAMYVKWKPSDSKRYNKPA